MKKVLVVGLSDNIGGVETFFHTYYAYMNNNKYAFDFVTVTNGVAFGDEYKQRGAKIFRAPHFLRHPMKYYNFMRKIIRENGYSIVHINMLSAANILPVRAALKERVPQVIVHSHNSGTPHGVLRKALDLINKRGLRNKRLIKVSCGKKAGDWLFGEKLPFRILPNAIDVTKFRYKKEYRKSVRKQLGVLDNDVLLGNVGRLCEQKNQSFLVDLLTELDQNYKLLMIGSGEDKEKILKKVDQNHVADRVIMLENTPDVEKYYSAMDVFVFPSVFEGMPIAPIEAQACGLVCVCSDKITREVDMGNVIFADLSLDKWVKIINTIKQDYARKTFLLEKYDIKKQAKELERIYDTGVDNEN